MSLHCRFSLKILQIKCTLLYCLLCEHVIDLSHKVKKYGKSMEREPEREREREKGEGGGGGRRREGVAGREIKGDMGRGGGREIKVIWERGRREIKVIWGEGEGEKR